MSNTISSTNITSSKYILSLPNAEATKLSKIFEENTLDKVDVTVHLDSGNFVSLIEEVGEKNVGVMLVDPAERLWKAYSAFKKRAEFTQSFKEFYSASARVNLFHRVLKGIDIEKLGYIGIRESFYKSIMLGELWHKSKYHRIPYGVMHVDSFLNTGSLAKQALMSEEVLKEIRTLYAEDYLIYQQACALFNTRWKQYAARASITTTKKVCIHLGPPKTGTSAIQSWLNRSVNALKSKNIYYPEHRYDKNGVSSGNFEEIVSYTKENRAFFDDKKIEKLINEFNDSGNHLLLLSSEHFFYYLLWFFTRLPQAQYIFYIRHPIPSLESGFHQEVKRHKRTTDFVVPKNLGFQNLAITSDLARAFDVKVTYRYFGDESFEGGSLHSDFARCFDDFIEPPQAPKRLNTQYSSGALQLMRLANKFADNWLLTELDFFLQKESESIDNFSLLSLQQSTKLQADLIANAQRILSKDTSVDMGKLLNLLNSFKPLNSFSKEEEKSDVARIIYKLKKKKPVLAFALYNQFSVNNLEDDVKYVVQLLEPKKYKKIVLRCTALYKKIRVEFAKLLLVKD